MANNMKVPKIPSPSSLSEFQQAENQKEGKIKRKSFFVFSFNFKKKALSS